MCKLLSRDRTGDEAFSVLLRRMAETPVLKDIHSGASVGYPGDLLDLMMQFIFIDGPAASNSRTAKEELVSALVSCVQRLLDSRNTEGMKSSTCFTHCVKFLEEKGLMKVKRRRSQNGLPLKSLGSIAVDANNTENTILTRSTSNYL